MQSAHQYKVRNSSWFLCTSLQCRHFDQLKSGKTSETIWSLNGTSALLYQLKPSWGLSTMFEQRGRSCLHQTWTQAILRQLILLYQLECIIFFLLCLQCDSVHTLWRGQDSLVILTQEGVSRHIKQSLWICRSLHWKAPLDICNHTWNLNGEW